MTLCPSVTSQLMGGVVRRLGPQTQGNINLFLTWISFPQWGTKTTQTVQTIATHTSLHAVLLSQLDRPSTPLLRSLPNLPRSTTLARLQILLPYSLSSLSMSSLTPLKHSYLSHIPQLTEITGTSPGNTSKENLSQHGLSKTTQTSKHMGRSAPFKVAQQAK